MIKLGQISLLGLAGEADFSNAEYWFKKVIKLSCSDAANTLGEYLIKRRDLLRTSIRVLLT